MRRKGLIALSYLLIMNVVLMEVKAESSNSTKIEINVPDILTQQTMVATARQSGYGLVTFEGQEETSNYNEPVQQSYGLVKFDDQPSNPSVQQGSEPVSFGDQYTTPQDVQRPLKKKRRRRRKPRLQNSPGHYGLLTPGAPNAYNPAAMYGPYRPHRRRRPSSLADDTITAVTAALGSIAQYDDLQCVPRLLCEVAGGKGPGGATTTGSQISSMLPSFIDLQPLITLLAAFNGLSSSPLFVFGRAVFLGVTSKGNTGTCRYAYPLCPTDPDKLVDYLNNHNGGFFRFFNGGVPQSQPPGLPAQQGLQQFYTQLSNIPGGYLHPHQQGVNSNVNNYGLLPNPEYGNPPSYGLNNLDVNAAQQNYGFQNPNIHLNQPDYNNQNYGPSYPHQHNKYGYLNKNSFPKDDIDDNKIEKRIQNKPDVVYVDTRFEDSANSKWTFPKTDGLKVNPAKNRVTKSLQFPNEHYEVNKEQNNGVTKPLQFPEVKEHYVSYDEQKRKGKDFLFPGSQSNRQYIEYYNYPPLAQVPQNTDNNKIKYDEEGYYVDSDIFEAENNKNEEGVELIYILRGNGDPNNPEIVKLKPGQKLS